VLRLARTGKTGIFVYDRTLWQIKPQGTYGEKRFRLFLGDVARKPRILEEDTEVVPEDARLVMEVPEEFRSEFERDMRSAIRDIAGSATFALPPFIVNTEAVSKAFGQSQSVLSVGSTDFAASRPLIYPNRIIRPAEPRMAHVDLGLTGDSAGVAIRKLFYKLREQGMNLKWISFDSYQSPQSGLIDHPPDFSKDCADAVAGVVYGLTYRREIWTRHRVPINPTLITLVQAMEDREKKLEAGRR